MYDNHARKNHLWHLHISQSFDFFFISILFFAYTVMLVVNQYLFFITN